MKLAILADIHGNWPALEAVADDVDRWGPDLVLVNGDIVNGGPSSDRCWATVRERAAADGWYITRGNHETYVAEWAEPGRPLHGPVYELSRLSHWTYGQLNGDVAALSALPERWEWTAPDGTHLIAMHATRVGDRAGLYPHTGDMDARRMIDPAAAVFVTSHTHIPHQRTLDGRRVLNTGAVGLTGDGDRRAAYARLTWDPAGGWAMGIRRVAYDVAAAERAFHTSGFLAGAGPLALMTLVELRTARDAKTRWTGLYRQAVLQGQIDMETAVAEFLDTPEFRAALGAERDALRYKWAFPLISH